MEESFAEPISPGVACDPGCSGEVSPPPHILFVGDDRVTSEYLRENRFRVTTMVDEALVREALQGSVVDAVVLALAPEQEGAPNLAQRMRSESPVPIIVLSARRDEFDRVMALELGADDCLTHPFNLRELLARVRAMLRRRRIDLRQPRARGPRAYRFGDWELNVNLRRLDFAARRQVMLTNGECGLLVALLGASGRTLSRMQLLELSRLHDDEVYERAVDMLVMRLRRKLEADTAAPRYLLTERGVGYRIGVPVEPVY